MKPPIASHGIEYVRSAIAKVSMQSMPARTKAGRSVIAVALPHDVVVGIVGRVAASSPQPMADLCSLRATYVHIYTYKNTYILLFILTS